MGMMLFFEGTLLRLGNVRILFVYMHYTTLGWCPKSEYTLLCWPSLVLYHILSSHTTPTGCVDWHRSGHRAADRPAQPQRILHERESPAGYCDHVDRWVELTAQCIDELVWLSWSSLALAGILLVFWGKPKLGLLIELFGLLNLFGWVAYVVCTLTYALFSITLTTQYPTLRYRNMFPLILAVGRSIPVIGDIIVAFEGSSSTRAQPRRYETRQPRYDPDF